MDRPFFFYYLNVYVIYLEFELTNFLLIFNMEIKKTFVFLWKKDILFFIQLLVRTIIKYNDRNNSIF